MNKDDKLKKILDEASKDATHIVSNPDTINKLRAKGVPIEEKFITYEEYFEKLVTEKRKTAVALLSQLPKLDESIANGVIASIYEEVRASFGLGIFTSTLFNSILLLEFAMRCRLHEERLKNDPNAEWSNVKKLKMKGLITALEKSKIIAKKEKSILDDFNDKFRNPYLHINIHKMITGIYADGIKKVDTNKNEVTIENQVDVSKHRQLWFLAKKFYDRSYVLHVLNFCIHWTNKLLKNNGEQSKREE